MTAWQPAFLQACEKTKDTHFTSPFGKWCLINSTAFCPLESSHKIPPQPPPHTHTHTQGTGKTAGHEYKEVDNIGNHSGDCLSAIHIFSWKYRQIWCYIQFHQEGLNDLCILYPLYIDAFKIFFKLNIFLGYMSPSLPEVHYKLVLIIIILYWG